MRKFKPEPEFRSVRYAVCSVEGCDRIAMRQVEVQFEQAVEKRPVCLPHYDILSHEAIDTEHGN